MLMKKSDGQRQSFTKISNNGCVFLIAHYLHGEGILPLLCVPYFLYTYVHSLLGWSEPTCSPLQRDGDRPTLAELGNLQCRDSIRSAQKRVKDGDKSQQPNKLIEVPQRCHE